MTYKFVEDSEITEISDSSDEINITEDFEESIQLSFNENRQKKIQEENLDLNEIQNELLDLSLPKSSCLGLCGRDICPKSSACCLYL